MTKEQLLRENQELKDRIIELQSEVIRLKTIHTPTKEIRIIEREIIREKDDSPFDPYCPPLPNWYYGDPLPPLPETTCGRNAMEWEESRKAFL